MMNRPLSLRRPLLIACAIIACSLTAPGAAQDDEFVEGGHYELLTEVQPVQTGDKIEVVELFWYLCPHCYRIEPYMQRWLKNKPENAEFVLMPAVLSKQWEYQARAYYVFEALGMVDELHSRFFDAIHRDKRAFRTPEQLADWVAERDGDRQAVLNTFDSFAVENKLNFSRIMSRQYGVSGVPAIIVDGRYRTSVSLAGGHEQMGRLINFLVRKATELKAG